MPTIDEVESLLAKMREQEDEKIQSVLTKAERDRDAALAAKAAEDGRRKAAWWADQKPSRHRVIVPANQPVSHIEFGGVGRHWRNHRGEEVSGTEQIPTEIEDGKRVIYLHLNDFRALVDNNRNGLDWQRANPELMHTLSGFLRQLPAPPSYR